MGMGLGARGRILPLFHLTSKGSLRINASAPAALYARGDFILGARKPRSEILVRGEVPEWLKGTDCKSVGFAYAGSNPALSTIPPYASSVVVSPLAVLGEVEADALALVGRAQADGEIQQEIDDGRADAGPNQGQ